MKPLVADTLPASDATRLTPDALHAALLAEFGRLNAAHFGGRLAVPEIVLSRRKTYGGYYQPARHRIVLSWQAYWEHGWPETINCFRHEIAHCIHPNHSRAFWALAMHLGAAQRHARAPLCAAAPRRRFLYACLACGRQCFRARRLRAASCAACDTRYNPRFALHLVREEPPVR